jgi:hypothetical protein
MSQILAPPLEPGPPSRRRRPKLLSDDPDVRSVQIGLAATLLIHLIVLLLAPRILSVNAAHTAPIVHAKPKPFHISLAPTLTPPKKKPVAPPNKFVETNPNAPENIPDNTRNFSNRNQQVAQEKPTPNGKSDMPTTEGRKDIQSTQIVDGRLSKPEESVPVQPQPLVPPRPASPEVPKALQNPLSGFEKTKTDTGQGAATSAAPLADNARPIPRKIDGTRDAPLAQSSSPAVPEIDPKHPQPRPMLERHVRPAIFAENKIGTSNVGLQAADARWSNYGVYLQRMIETIQIEWDRLVGDSKTYPTPGTIVSVKFIMNSKGEIARIVSVDTPTGASEQAKASCVAGISARSPYGPWSDDMKAALGSEQELTFTFLYQ